MVKWTCSEIIGEMLSLPTSMTAFEVWQLNIQKLRILEDILEKWQQAGIDVLICVDLSMRLVCLTDWLHFSPNVNRYVHLNHS